MLLTILTMFKQRRITKEKYEQEYKINDEIDERGDLTLGDDLETFVTNIKHGGMAKATISDGETFLICLLNSNDRRRLDQKDKEFMGTFR